MLSNVVLLHPAETVSRIVSRNKKRPLPIPGYSHVDRQEAEGPTAAWEGLQARRRGGPVCGGCPDRLAPVALPVSFRGQGLDVEFGRLSGSESRRCAVAQGCCTPAAGLRRRPERPAQAGEADKSPGGGDRV